MKVREMKPKTAGFVRTDALVIDGDNAVHVSLDAEVAATGEIGNGLVELTIGDHGHAVRISHLDTGAVRRTDEVNPTGYVSVPDAIVLVW